MNYRRLLVSGLRNTRWGDFIEALGELITQFKKEKLTRFVNKFKIEETDEENLKDLITFRGFPLYILSGYTSSIQYLRRRNRALTFERLYRVGAKSYDYVMKSFWLKGNVFPLRKTDQDVFKVVRNPVESINSDAANFFVSDQEMPIIQYYIEGVPVPNPPIETELPVLLSDSEDLPVDQRILTLDSNEVRDYTNHFVIEYEFLVIEDEDVFQSQYTATAFSRTVNDSKRLKEVVHFQPRISIPLISGYGTVNTVEFQSYDRLMTSEQKTIWLTGGFEDVAAVQLGKGRAYEIGMTPITECNLPIDTYGPPLSGYFNVVEQTSDKFFIEYLSFEYSKLGIAATGAVSGASEVLSFSEVSLLNVSGDVLAYSYFPTVNLDPDMYSSVAFDFTIVAPSGS